MKILEAIRFNKSLKNSYAKMDMNMRTAKEVFLKKTEIHDLYLKADREDRDLTLLKSQLDILNWVLNDPS